MISQHVDTEDIYITRTIEQSDQSLDEIIEKKYPLVLCGGGDGTAMRIIEQMRLKVEAKNRGGGDYAFPRFGLLKLGTGNGWAGLLNVPSKVKPIWALRQLREHELVFSNFNMIELFAVTRQAGEGAESRLFHFGGLGVDALILNDYIDFKSPYTEGFMWKLGNSLAGYLIALFFKSIPKVLFQKFNINIRAINQSDAPVYKVSRSKGIEEIAVKKGETLYEGPSLIAGFGTTTNYGFNLKVFPYAREKRGYMNLRFADVTVPRALANLRNIWVGTWEYRGLYDFLVQDVRIECEQDAPFQLGGDPEGYRREVNLRVSDFTVDVMDFRR